MKYNWWSLRLVRERTRRLTREFGLVAILPWEEHVLLRASEYVLYLLLCEEWLLLLLLLRLLLLLLWVVSEYTLAWWSGHILAESWRTRWCELRDWGLLLLLIAWCSRSTLLQLYHSGTSSSLEVLMIYDAAAICSRGTGICQEIWCAQVDSVSSLVVISTSFLLKIFIQLLIVFGLVRLNEVVGLHLIIGSIDIWASIDELGPSRVGVRPCPNGEWGTECRRTLRNQSCIVRGAVLMTTAIWCQEDLVRWSRSRSVELLSWRRTSNVRQLNRWSGMLLIILKEVMTVGATWWS